MTGSFALVLAHYGNERPKRAAAPAPRNRKLESGERFLERPPLERCGSPKSHPEPILRVARDTCRMRLYMFVTKRDL